MVRRITIMSTPSGYASRSSATGCSTSPRRSRPVQQNTTNQSRFHSTRWGKTTYNLRIPPILLNPRLPRKAHTSRPLNRLTRHPLRHDTRPILRHRRLLREALPLFLAAGRIVGEESSGLDVDGGAGNLEGHALEGADGLAELLALIGVGDGFVEGALGETDHLGGDADAAFVEDFDGNLCVCTQRVVCQQGAKRSRRKECLPCIPCLPHQSCSPSGSSCRRKRVCTSRTL